MLPDWETRGLGALGSASLDLGSAFFALGAAFLALEVASLSLRVASGPLASTREPPWPALLPLATLAPWPWSPALLDPLGTLARGREAWVMEGGVLLQATKNKTYTPKNICSGVSKDRSNREYLA